MSVEALMNQAVTVQIPSGETRNAINEAEATYTEVSTTMYLEPSTGSGASFSASREEMIDRNTPITDWIGFGRTDVGFTSECRVLYGSHTFDVIGDPKPFWNPTAQRFSHVELTLQEVT